MDNVNKTLYIPLHGKSFVSRKNIILKDKKAEEIWEKEQFLLKGKSKSKWLAYYMGMRSAVFDNWFNIRIQKTHLTNHNLEISSGKNLHKVVKATSTKYKSTLHISILQIFITVINYGLKS